MQGGKCRLISDDTDGCHQRITSDYGAVSTNMYDVRVTNAKLAFLGKLDQVTWYGRSESAIFDKPEIEFNPGGGFSPGQTMTKTRLGVWIGKERAEELIDKFYPTTWPPAHLPFAVYSAELPAVREQIKLNIALAISKAMNGVSYIGPNDNPGRQYTSSFNPIFGNVREYYGPRAQIVKIGISDEVYWCIKRLSIMHLGRTYRDIINLICGHLELMFYREYTSAAK